MSHRFKAKNGTVFFHNGDYSGDVLIRAGLEQDAKWIKVPMEDLLHFVGCGYVRDEMVSWAENARYDKLLLRYQSEGA